MKKRNSQCGRRKERLFSNLCIMPSLLGFLIFFLIPFGIVIYYSLINNPITGDFVGLENYRKLVHTVAFRKAASNTATFSLISVPLAAVLSLFISLTVIFTVIFTVPVSAPEVRIPLLIEQPLALPEISKETVP